MIPRFTEREAEALRVLLNGLHDLGWLRTGGKMLGYLPRGYAAALRQAQRKLGKMERAEGPEE